MRPAARIAWLPLLIFLGCAHGPPARSERAVSPPVFASFGPLRIDVANKVLHVPGRVNQVRGAIELLACGPGGKTHESVFVLDVEPVTFQAALLALGFEPGGPPPGGKQGPPLGPRLEIRVAWDAASGRQIVPASRTVSNTVEQAALRETGWAFNGSEVVDGRLMAEVDESLVATYWDRWAVLNLPLPEGANDEILSANTAVLPSEGTPVVFLISARTVSP